MRVSTVLTMASLHVSHKRYTREAVWRVTYEASLIKICVRPFAATHARFGEIHFLPQSKSKSCYTQCYLYVQSLTATNVEFQFRTTFQSTISKFAFNCLNTFAFIFETLIERFLLLHLQNFAGYCISLEYSDIKLISVFVRLNTPFEYLPLSSSLVCFNLELFVCKTEAYRKFCNLFLHHLSYFHSLYQFPLSCVRQSLVLPTFALVKCLLAMSSDHTPLLSSESSPDQTEASSENLSTETVTYAGHKPMAEIPLWSPKEHYLRYPTDSTLSFFRSGRLAIEL